MTIERAQYEALEDEKPSYEEWLAKEYGVKVIDGGDIKVTDFLPSGPSVEYASDVWVVVIGETTYRYERWFTSNSGGVEWWDEEGNRIEGDDPGEYIVLGQQIALYNVVHNQRVPTDQFREATLDDIIHEFADRVSATYFTRYDEVVKPLVEQIKEEIFPIFATP